MTPRSCASTTVRLVSRRGFTVLESLLVLVLLTVLTVVSTALWIKAPASTSDEELRWMSEGGDASRLSPGLPSAEDPGLLPDMTSDTEIQLNKDAAKQAP